MPPTRVLTTCSPQAAASTMAMQKASVSEELRKMSPITSTSRTLSCLIGPSSVTRDCSRCRSITSSRMIRFGPSPPIRNLISGYLAQMEGMTPASRSMPFR